MGALWSRCLSPFLCDGDQNIRDQRIMGAGAGVGIKMVKAILHVVVRWLRFKDWCNGAMRGLDVEGGSGGGEDDGGGEHDGGEHDGDEHEHHC